MRLSKFKCSTCTIECLHAASVSAQRAECASQILTAIHQVAFLRHIERKHKCQPEGADRGKFRRKPPGILTIYRLAAVIVRKVCDGINHRISENHYLLLAKKGEGSAELAVFIMRTTIHLVEAERERLLASEAG